MTKIHTSLRRDIFYLFFTVLFVTCLSAKDYSIKGTVEDSKGNKTFPNKRRCLLYLTQLKEEGFLTTNFPVQVKYPEGNVASVRMFTRIK